MSLRRGVLATVAAVLVSMHAFDGVGPVDAAATGCGLPQGWVTSIALGSYGSEIDGHPVSAVTQQATAWTAVSGTRGVWLTTDGGVILRSADGGCHWTTTFNVSKALAGLDADLGTFNAYQVWDVESAQSARYTGRVTALLTATAADQLATGAYFPAFLPPALLATSDDGGVTWSVHGTPTSPDPIGIVDAPRCNPSTSIRLYVTAADPQVAYVRCNPDVVGSAQGQLEALFATRDDGQSWTFEANVPDGHASALAVDPLHANVVWQAGLTAVSSYGDASIYGLVVSRSTDYGAHGTESHQVQTKLSDLALTGLDVSPGAHGVTSVVVWSTDHGAAESTHGINGPWRTLGRVVKGGPLVTGAVYLPGSGDIVVARAINAAGNDATLSPSCGSSVSLTRYVGPARRAVALPLPRPWVLYLTSVIDLQAIAGPARSPSEIYMAATSMQGDRAECTYENHGRFSSADTYPPLPGIATSVAP